MIVVGTTIAWLMQHVRRTPNGFRIRFVRPRPREQSGLHARGAKDPLHGVLIAQEKRSYESPVPCFVEELKRRVWITSVARDTKTIVGEETGAIDRSTVFVGGVVNDVRVAAASMAVMTRVTAPPRRRKVADSNGP